MRHVFWGLVCRGWQDFGKFEPVIRQVFIIPKGPANSKPGVGSEKFVEGCSEKGLQSYGVWGWDRESWRVRSLLSSNNALI